MAHNYVFIGPAVHATKKRQITIIERAAIAVSKGKILSINITGTVDEQYHDYKQINLKQGQFLCPGFIDMHIHAPQFPNVGLGMDKPLLEWLEAYTIPLEKRYNDINFAETIYKYVVNSTIKCGTTMACYYGTIYKSSTQSLANIILQSGQRALIGKVNMNQNSILDYVENTEQSLKETEEFINYVYNLNDPLVEPAVTPRFAISCNMELLEGLGKLAAKYNAYIQTHVSENKAEIAFASKLFPECKNYSHIYETANLLTRKTILAHGVHLTDEEKCLISQQGVAIAHCPNSNTLLQSGQCDVRSLWHQGVNIGLGTDIAGGCNPSILDAMKSALSTSLHISFHKENYLPLNFHEVFYLATIGAAKALRKDHLIGNFEEGKEFDALIVDMYVDNSLSGSMAHHTLLELFQKFIYTGDDRNIKSVYVKGKLIYES